MENLLLEKYKEKLKGFEELKLGLESQMEGNDDAMTMGNMYYMLLSEIVNDLKTT